MCQLLCCMLTVFSLRFVKRNRLSDQCLAVYKANGHSDGGGTIGGTGRASNSFPEAHDIDILRWGERFVYYFILFLRSIHCVVHHLLPYKGGWPVTILHI